jgi:hypothetical protein
MEAELDPDLTLTKLAAESGYSRTHFLRMFRGAMGLSPDRYLLDLRLKKRNQCPRIGDLPLDDRNSLRLAERTSRCCRKMPEVRFREMITVKQQHAACPDSVLP